MKIQLISLLTFVCFSATTAAAQRIDENEPVQQTDRHKSLQQLQVEEARLTRHVSKPNVVVIVVDDLGQRDVGCYGSTFYETPYIDRLAREGSLFTDAYTACPVCSPTRCSLMTGL